MKNRYKFVKTEADSNANEKDERMIENKICYAVLCGLLEAGLIREAEYLSAVRIISRGGQVSESIGILQSFHG